MHGVKMIHVDQLLWKDGLPSLASVFLTTLLFLFRNFEMFVSCPIRFDNFDFF